MSGHSTYEPKTGFTRWLDKRLPIVRLAHDSFIAFPTPRNLNYWWTFGAILSFMLIAQIVTGVVLAMHYTPDSVAMNTDVSTSAGSVGSLTTGSFTTRGRGRLLCLLPGASGHPSSLDLLDHCAAGPAAPRATSSDGGPERPAVP